MKYLWFIFFTVISINTYAEKAEKVEKVEKVEKAEKVTVKNSIECVTLNNETVKNVQLLDIKKTCAKKMKIKQTYKAKKIKVKKGGCLSLGNIGVKNKCQK